MAYRLLFRKGVFSGVDVPASYNVYLCDTEADLPSVELKPGFIAITKDNLGRYYHVNSSLVWVKEDMKGNPGAQGPPGPQGDPGKPELAWPLDSVFCVANEKEPADLLGFGKWELIIKEPVFMWRRVG